MSATLQAPPGLGRARAGVTLVFLANGSAFGAWGGVIPTVKAGLGLSASELSLGLVAVGAGAITAMPLVGWLGARGWPHLLAACGALCALALPWPGLAPSLPALVASLFALGACSGAMDVVMNARASEVETAGGRAIMSSFHAAFSLGGMAGAAGSGALLAAGLGAEGCLLAGAAWVAVLVAAGAALGIAGRSDGEAGFAWPSRAVLGLGVLCLLAFMAEGAVLDWSGVFMAAVAGWHGAATALAFAAFSAAMVLGRLTGDRVVRRLGRRRVLQGGALLSASGFGVAALWPQAGVAGFFLVGLGASNLAPILLSAAGRAGAAASTGVAAVAAIGYAGFLGGPPVIGAVADLVGLRVAVALLVLVAGAIALGGRRVE